MFFKLKINEMKNINYKYRINLFIIILLTGLVSCKKYVTVDPPYTQFSADNLFKSEEGALAAMHGVYNALAIPDGFATDQFASVTLMGGLSADEFSGLAYPQGSDPYNFFTNALLPTTPTLQQLWLKPYNIIFMCNSILEAMDKSVGISDSVKKQIEGEAKFMRAFLHFYLVNMYGHIPLVLTTDWKINSVQPQTDPSVVYEQIIKDLQDAKIAVGEAYPRSSERLYINRGTVSALLARAYAYTKNWSLAEAEATAVIDNGLYDLETDLNKVFLINSPEIIWQLKPIEAYGTNTQEGGTIYSFYDPSYAPYLTDELVSAFENTDQRKLNWVSNYSNGTNTWYFPFKYKLNSSEPVTQEYSVVLRLSEVYLIRAEARAQQNKLNGTGSAAEDIDKIRVRAGLSGVTVSTQQEILDAIYHERRVELFAEWGSRWFDLKRWGIADNVLSAAKGAGWQITDTIYPIPQVQIDNNPATIQNPGYQ